MGSVWRVRMDSGEKEVELPEERMRVDALLRALNLRLEEYIVIRNGEVLTEKDWVSREDDVELVRVISGG